MFRASMATSDYGVEPFVNTNHPRAGASIATLISSERRESSTSTFDDSAHLTAIMSSEPLGAGNWQAGSAHRCGDPTDTASYATLQCGALPPLFLWNDHQIDLPGQCAINTATVAVSAHVQCLACVTLHKRSTLLSRGRPPIFRHTRKSLRGGHPDT
jgi:hypothetical protein